MIRRAIRLFSSLKNKQEPHSTPTPIDVFLEKYGRTIAWSITLSNAAIFLWLIDKRTGGRLRNLNNDSSLNPQAPLNPPEQEGDLAEIYSWGSSKKSKNTPTELQELKGKIFRQLLLTDGRIFAISHKGDVLKLARDGISTILPNYGIVQLSVINDDLYGLTNSGVVYKISNHAISIMHSSDRINQIDSTNNALIALTKSGVVLALKDDKFSTAWSFPEKIAQVACGNDHILARTVNGNVYGIGSNSHGQLATGEYKTNLLHLSEPLLNEYLWNSTRQARPLHIQCKNIAAGGNTSLFVIENEKDNEIKVLSCGEGILGQLGNGSYNQIQATPVPIPSLSLTEYNEKLQKIMPIKIDKLQISKTHGICVLSTGIPVYKHKTWWQWLTGSSPDLEKEIGGRDVLSWGSNKGDLLLRNEKGGGSTPSWMNWNVDWKKDKRDDEDGEQHHNSRLSLQTKYLKNEEGKLVLAKQDIVVGDGETVVYWKVVQ